jgi:hypothetical protein
MFPERQIAAAASAPAHDAQLFHYDVLVRRQVSHCRMPQHPPHERRFVRRDEPILMSRSSGLIA